MGVLVSEVRGNDMAQKAFHEAGDRRPLYPTQSAPVLHGLPLCH